MGKEIGNVLWFDQKKGFGFVRVITPDSKLKGTEVFVHFTQINCENSYKKLYPGENVQLTVEKSTDQSDSKREYTSSNIEGLYGTKLLVDNEDHIIKVIRKRESRNVVRGDDDMDTVETGVDGEN